MVRHIVYTKKDIIYNKKAMQKYLQKNEIKLRHQHHHSHLINHLYYNYNHLHQL
jgi:hypothetical protein